MEKFVTVLPLVLHCRLGSSIYQFVLKFLQYTCKWHRTYTCNYMHSSCAKFTTHRYDLLNVADIFTPHLYILLHAFTYTCIYLGCKNVTDCINF